MLTLARASLSACGHIDPETSQITARSEATRIHHGGHGHSVLPNRSRETIPKQDCVKPTMLSQSAGARSDSVKAYAMLGTYTVHVSSAKEKVLYRQSTFSCLHTDCSRYRCDTRAP